MAISQKQTKMLLIWLSHISSQNSDLIMKILHITLKVWKLNWRSEMGNVFKSEYLFLNEQ